MKTWPKMNATWKRRWVKALRSGKYEQGKGELVAGGKYCCLGVLADVAGVSGTRGAQFIGNISCRRVGLPEGCDRDSVQHSLANRNDGANKKRRWRFPEIADWIEVNL